MSTTLDAWHDASQCIMPSMNRTKRTGACRSAESSDEWLSVQVPRSRIGLVQVVGLQLDTEITGQPYRSTWWVADQASLEVRVIHRAGDVKRPLGTPCRPSTLSRGRAAAGDVVDVYADCQGTVGEYVLLRLPGASRQISALEMCARAQHRTIRHAATPAAAGAHPRSV